MQRDAFRHRAHVRRLRLRILALFAVALFALGASATSVVPVEITMHGPKAVRVRIYSGQTSPCDSSNNHRVVDGRFEPGHVIRTTARTDCVCFQQTYEPFVEIDWSTPVQACRIKCNRGGCRYVDHTIRIGVVSSPPRR
jgi:hypothetical protein